MRQHYMQIVRDSDNRVRRSLDIQELDQNSPFYGGFRSIRLGVPDGRFAIYRVTTMTACLFNQDSRWYLDPLCYERILLGLSYIRSAQRESGFFDLGTLNFESAPDTAFCLKRLLPVYHYLSSTEQIEGSAVDAAKLCAIYREIIVKAADAIVTGGFHTPNHRWAITSVMLLCWRFFGEEKYKAFADSFLAEGIDNTSDGEFAERSAGNYNRVNNDAMITIAAALDDETYNQYALKNLHMMLQYIDPDDSIFTNNSTRQDYGKKIHLKDYYFEYLYLGERYHDETLLKAANAIMETGRNHGLKTFDCLIHFMNAPHLIDFEYEESGIEPVYHKFFEESNIVRSRNRDYSYTILGKSPYFLYFQNGPITMALKLLVPYYEHRAFVPSLLTKEEDSYQLSQTMNGWYYLPFGEFRGTSDWWAMDNPNTRKKIPGPDLNLKVSISEIENGLSLTVSADGIDRVPIAMEMSFNETIRIENENLMTDGTNRGSVLLKKGDLLATLGDYAVKVGPAFGSHSQMTPPEGRPDHSYTAVFTEFTNFSHTVTITALPSPY